MMTNDPKQEPRNSSSSRHMSLTGRISPLEASDPALDMTYAMPKEQVQMVRKLQGLCTTCRGTPVKLFEKTNNPMVSKPLSVPSESYKGVCLKCHPNLGANSKPTSSTRTALTRNEPSNRSSLHGSLRVTRRRDSSKTGSLLEQMNESNDTMNASHVLAGIPVEPPPGYVAKKDYPSDAPHKVDSLNVSRRDSVPIPVHAVARRSSTSTGEQSDSPQNSRPLYQTPTSMYAVRESATVDRVRRAYERTFSQVSMDDISALTLDLDRSHSASPHNWSGEPDSSSSPRNWDGGPGNSTPSDNDSLLDEFSVPDFSAGTDEGVRAGGRRPKSRKKSRAVVAAQQQNHNAAPVSKPTAKVPPPQFPQAPRVAEKPRKTKGLRSSPMEKVAPEPNYEAAKFKQETTTVGKKKKKKDVSSFSRKYMPMKNNASAIPSDGANAREYKMMKSNVSAIPGPDPLYSVERRSLEPVATASPTLVGTHTENDNTFSHSLEAQVSEMPSQEGASLAPPSLVGMTETVGELTTGESLGIGSGITLDSKVEEVESLINDVMAAENVEFLADLLGNTMRSHRERQDIQALCLRTIWDLSKYNDENKACVMASGLYDCITAAMKDHPNSVTVQERGCGALWSLSVNQFNRVVLVRAGACERILRALDAHLNHEAFVQTALGALRTLSPEPEARLVIKHMLGAQRAARAMALHRSVVNIQRDGCAFLSNSAVDMDLQEVAVASKEELQAVVRAMRDHLKNESVITSACFALKNYTYEEKNLRSLRRFEDVVSLLEDAAQYATKASCRADAAEVLKRIRMLRAEDDSLEETAFSSLMQAMRRNSMESNPAKQVEDSVSTITDVIQEYYWSIKLICFGLESLLSLIGKSEAHMSRVMAPKTLRVVISTMNDHKSNPKVQQRGCELLNCLAEARPEHGPLICLEEGCGAIVAALQHHRGDLSVQMPAYGALKALSRVPMCSEDIQRNGGWQIIRDTEQDLQGGGADLDESEGGFRNIRPNSAFHRLPAASGP